MLADICSKPGLYFRPPVDPHIDPQGNHDELMALEGGMYQALAASQETRRTSQVGLQEAASPTAAAEEEKQEATL